MRRSPVARWGLAGVIVDATVAVASRAADGVATVLGPLAVGRKEVAPVET